MTRSVTDITVRRMQADDESAVSGVLEAALGRRQDAQSAAFFAWKHRQNFFGPSPAWVALDEQRVVGFRTLMRWEFSTPDGPVRAVRAVDTATHPSYQGRGVFTALTRRAVEELRSEGVHFVFNTPNDQSRPGYLKMGWQEVGRLPTGMRPASPAVLPRLARARVPADIWSLPSSAGWSLDEVLGDDAAVARLLAAAGTPTGVATRRTPAFLRWRYGFQPLAYRAFLAGPSVDHGLLVFRLRRRGVATELVVADVLVPGRSRSATRRLIAAALRASKADYALGLRTTSASGLLPVPGQGPMLTWRALTSESMPPLGQWRLALGDVELF